MLDLNALPGWYVNKHGLAKVAEVAGKSTSLFAMLQKRNKVPLDAVSRLLAFDPAPLHEIKPLYPAQDEGTRLVILVPLTGNPEPKMMDTLVRLYDRQKMAYRRVAFNCLSVSRNTLAAIFLRGPWEWAYWLDADSLLPAGDAEWFKTAAEVPGMPDSFANINAISRSLSHKKTIVSCCYVGRKKGAPPQFGGGSTPEMRAKVKRGPRDELIERPWAGMGGMLTHRSVFTDIIKTQGDEIKMKPDGIGAKFGYDHGFFNPLDGETPSDDLPFCYRATRAGHKVFVDLAIQAGHIGDRCFTWNDL